MIVVAIIGTLASIAVPALNRVNTRAQILRTATDIKTIETDILVFEVVHSRVPNDLAEIKREDLRDPWGRPYVYLSFAAAGAGWIGQARKDHSLNPLNSSFDLYSMGRDGQSSPALSAMRSRDDIVRAYDGGFIGLACEF